MKNTTIAKRSTVGDNEQFKILADVLALIDGLFQMRLIEKISRPIEDDQKKQHIEKYALKF